MNENPTLPKSVQIFAPLLAVAFVFTILGIVTVQAFDLTHAQKRACNTMGFDTTETAVVSVEAAQDAYVRAGNPDHVETSREYGLLEPMVALGDPDKTVRKRQNYTAQADRACARIYQS